MAAPVSEVGTYVYCVARASRAPSLKQAPAGLAGAGPTRALRAADALWVIAADVPLDRYGEAPLAQGLRDLDWVARCAVAHEAVVEHLARRAPVVPMKLFTIFRGDDRAVAHVGRERRRLERTFRRIAGGAEWGVRILRRPEDGAAGPSDRAVSGADFLRRKKEARDALREAARAGTNVARQVHAALARLARDARIEPRVPGEAGARLLLDAAYLVADSRRARFHAAARRLARACGAAGCELVLTGPWPAYHFIEAS